MLSKWEKRSIIVGVVTGIIGALTGVGALWISGLTYFSDQQNFELEKRPYLTVKPVKLDNGKYLALEKGPGQLAVHFAFQMQNDGELPAVHIQKPTQMTMETADGELAGVEFNVTPNDTQTLTLTSGQKIQFEYVVTINNQTFTTLENVSKQFDDGTLSYPVKVQIAYKSSPNGLIDHSTYDFVIYPDADVPIENSFD